MPPEVVLRPATADDWDWIVSQVPRLREFGPPPWRTPEQMDSGEIADLRAAFEQLDDPERLLLIAARHDDGERLGFLLRRDAHRLLHERAALARQRSPGRARRGRAGRSAARL